MSQKLKIFILEDEPELLNILTDELAKSGFDIMPFSDPTAALPVFKQNMHNTALVLSDLRMPKMTGFEFRRATLPDAAAVPFVILSAYITKEMALEALDLKISSFHNKPESVKDIAKVVAKESKKRVEEILETLALESVFIEDAKAIIDENEAILLSLENDRTNQDSLNVLYRAAHTLKGTSGFLETDVITKYIHKYEDIISELRKNTIAFSDRIYEILLKGHDRIKNLLSKLEDRTIFFEKLEDLLPELDYKADTKPATDSSHTADSTAAAKAAPKADVPKSTLKNTSIPVPKDLLDELASRSGEITVIRNMVNKIVRSLERKYAGDREVANLSEFFDEMHKINSSIQTRITDLRKVPFAGVVKSFPRIMRDLSVELGKKFKFKVSGESLRLDNALAQACSNSVIHLIRNSADHGLEMPEDRIAAGKPEEGTISITASENSNEVLVVVQDDGAGIDPDRIKAKAIEKGLYKAEELAQMPDSQLFLLIFASGFSTAKQVSSVSGRGVGMDMVKSSVEEVGGSIDIESKKGVGTTLTLHLPIPKSVLIINSLLISYKKSLLAIPQDSIVRVLRLTQKEAQSMLLTVGHGIVFKENNELFPYLDLNSVLDSQESSDTSTKNDNSNVDILIVRSESLIYALRVEAFFDIEEVVVKKVPDFTNFRGIFKGATFLGDGTVGLIIDTTAFAASCQLKAGANETEAEKTPKSVQSLANTNYILFKQATPSTFGIDLLQVFRLELLDRDSFQKSGAQESLIYRGQIVPIVRFDEILGLKPQKETQLIAKIPTILVKHNNGFIGFEVEEIIDIAATEHEVSTEICDRPGIIGNTFIHDQLITILDINCLLQKCVRKLSSNKSVR